MFFEMENTFTYVEINCFQREALIPVTLSWIGLKVVFKIFVACVSLSSTSKKYGYLYKFRHIISLFFL